MGLFKSANEKQVNKLKKIADKIEAKQDEYKTLTDEQLKHKTVEFKEMLKNGATLDDILVDAFATVREASDRVLKMRHFYVQLLGGIVLFEGRIAEMKTGEGKTLVATLPVYLNALTGQGVHVVTVNEYLAQRDAEWMGKVYNFLGLTVGINLAQMSFEDKKKAYECDITYGTNNEFGFDFLRDNMAITLERKVQRSLKFAIVDEVDSILIDEARTPLIISGQGSESSELYVKADRFAKTKLNGRIDTEESGARAKLMGDVPQDEGYDYVIVEKDKTIRLTEEGALKAERFFNVANITDPENNELVHYIHQALKANYLMKKDRDYIVADGEVVIVDEFTGRLMIGRRFNEGLHQAIEAKEHVRVQSENQTLATITFQNYFRMYDKLSGMTGTAKTEEDEFQDIYNLDVVVMPTNRPMIRKDEHDQLYTTIAGKTRAIINDIEKCSESGQPVLVGTSSVEKSEELSKELRKAGIKHNVLNAKNHRQEAEIIAQAGKLGAVTIATNMAGRGTDIMLGGNPEFLAKRQMERDGTPHEYIVAATSFAPTTDENIISAKKLYNELYEKFKAETDAEKEKVIELGGLRIIGTERHESRRIDNQLRGRAGRQGDPGSTVFYISMEDDLARVFGGPTLKALAMRLHFDEDTPIANRIITRQIEKAQKRLESRNYSYRKHVLSYDDVMNKQRELIYKERNEVLEGHDIRPQILSMIDTVAHDIVAPYINFKKDYNGWDYDAINNELESKLLPAGSNAVTPELASHYNEKMIIEKVSKLAHDAYEARIKDAEEKGIDFDKVERMVLLRSVDRFWMEHIDCMDQLRKGISLRAYGQTDPVMAYRREGYDMFEEMVDNINRTTTMQLLKLEFKPVNTNEQKERKMFTNASDGTGNAPQRVAKKPGRNDPCPCGSGKKYKNCCGRNE